MSQISEADVQAEVRTWLSANWDPELSLVVISHDPIVLRYICDRFVVIYKKEEQTRDYIDKNIPTGK